MSSLVAYEDSESETDQTEEGISASDQTGSFDQVKEVRLCTSSGITLSYHSFLQDHDSPELECHGNIPERVNLSPNPHSQPLSSSNWERKLCSDWKAQKKQFIDTSSPLNLFTTQRKSSPIQTSLHTPNHFSEQLKPPKRLCTVPSVVRPYIPKRQRLATSEQTKDPKLPPEQLTGNQSKDRQILSEVSERVKPYLAQKLGTAEIPKRLLMRLGGHQGPVNKVQWCPVPQQSHLLLSASMDKTFKVWDGAESGRCLKVYPCHSGAVRDACWTPCGRHLLTGSFDNLAAITDVETGQQVEKFDNQFKVMCTALHPSSPEVFLCGGYSSVVKAWDSRSCKQTGIASACRCQCEWYIEPGRVLCKLVVNAKAPGYLSVYPGALQLCASSFEVVNVYKAGIQQTLDILFLRGGAEFITSSDCVSRDSADRTLVAWDYQTTAKVSNQIYHERYTCPSLALHPLEESFIAQTNGNYIAVFSSQQPYRMNKRRRYEGHKVEGYAVHCKFSLDGTILTTGSSTGLAHFYDYHNARLLHTLCAHSQPCLCVSQHPVLPATAATCDWAGEIKVWH